MRTTGSRNEPGPQDPYFKLKGRYTFALDFPSANHCGPRRTEGTMEPRGDTDTAQRSMKEAKNAEKSCKSQDSAKLSAKDIAFGCSRNRETRRNIHELSWNVLEIFFSSLRHGFAPSGTGTRKTKVGICAAAVMTQISRATRNVVSANPCRLSLEAFPRRFCRCYTGCRISRFLRLSSRKTSQQYRD